MISFDKTKIKEQLTIDNIFDLLNDFGGDPQMTSFGILSATICHNAPGYGSHKLYYYSNTQLFKCYTGCAEPTFDIFELVIKVSNIQKNKKIDLNAAIIYIAQRFGLQGVEYKEESPLEDWKVISNHERIRENKNNYVNFSYFQLTQYDKHILNAFNYIKIGPWLQEGIIQEVIDLANIGYYSGGAQISIPHYDKDNNLIGIRGRSLVATEAELYGKYRPIKMNNIIYSHPLGLNLYGLNWAKENIKNSKKVIVVEGEKSVLKYISIFGKENNICVASCGSNLSTYQCELLLNSGANEIIIAYDKQCQNPYDNEATLWKEKLKNIYKKLHNYINISVIWDRDNLLQYKNSPLDEGEEKFAILLKNREKFKYS